jgi:hypothetical protein
MAVFMWILMRRNRIASEGDLVQSSRTNWLSLLATTLLIWLIRPSRRKMPRWHTKLTRRERHLLDPPAMHPRDTSWFRQGISRLQTVLHSRAVGSLGHPSNSSRGYLVSRHSSRGP